MTATALKYQSPLDPTASQRAASDPASSVWVNASAGSGKTSVLTARVTRLLLDGTAPQKILCLTYTRAGAAEMANRVTAQFSKWASCDDDALRDDLAELQAAPATPHQLTEARRLFARVLACPGGLRIRTIHSFCQEILSRFPVEAGLPPHFALIDEQELAVLKDAVIDELLLDAAAHPDQKLAQALTVLAAAQGEHGVTQTLHDALRERGRLAAACDRAGGVEPLIERMRRALLLDPADTPDDLRAAAMSALPDADMRHMAAWLAQGTPSHVERGRLLADILDSADRAARFDDYRTIFLKQDNDPRTGSGIASKNIRALYPAIDDLSLREAARLRSVLERIEAADIAALTAAVLTFGQAFTARLQQRKAARAALDYDDLILLTGELLKRPGIAPWILYKLDHGIDHILVDEAQDTSRAQWDIVQALTAEFYAGEGARSGQRRSLFVVGDEKQSIFSFQNADPQAFLDLRDAFATRLAQAGGRLEKIQLHTSFRSAPAILTAVDTIFASPEICAGVSPDPVTHRAWKNRDGSDKLGRVEVWPLLKPLSNDDSDDDAWVAAADYQDEHDPQAELARLIAAKIAGWLARRETLPDSGRAIVPGDIMILLRRRGRLADLMVRALKARKVPVTGVDRMRLIRQLPVMDLLAALRFVLLPDDDLNLACLLRGPLLGLDEDQLMALAIGRDGSLWRSLQRHAAASPAFAAAHDYLAARLNEADFSTPFAFLSGLLDAPCPADSASGRRALWTRLGEEALDPIEELLNAAQAFAHGHAPSLQNFLRWLTHADAEIKRELDRGDIDAGGQVRIMTVHASKGLEAPIVFLPDTTAPPLPQALPKFQWQDDIPLFLARRPDFGAAREVWNAARDRQLQEYRRLFYVALTRASRRLYICGWQNGRQDGAGQDSWYHMASAALRPLHQDHIPAEASDGITPDIVCADLGIAPPPAHVVVSPASVVPIAPLPDWARYAAAESAPMLAVASSAADSPASATPDAAFARGRIIHRLLQSLPDIAPDRRAAAAARFLAHPRHTLDEHGRAAIAGEVAALLDDETFAALFGADSVAEVPLTGNIDGVPVFRQIDRLCLRDGEVWIVDYKTNRPPPDSAADIPDAYRRQLNEYRILLGGIYPDRKIHCFLLWTYAPRLMEIDF